jgi:hypothetical protein
MAEPSGAEARFPPLDRYDLQGQLDGTSIEVLGQLGDHDDPVSEPLTAEIGLDLKGWATASPLLPSSVVRRVASVQDTADPGHVTHQFDVAIDDFGVDLGIEHHRRPTAQRLVCVRREEGDLGVQTITKIVVIDDLPNGCGQAGGVPNNLAAQLDELSLIRLGRQQASYVQNPSPDHARIPNQLEHDVLREDAPPLTSSPLEHLVDDRDRQHDHDDARSQASQQGMALPEGPAGEIRCHAGDHNGEDEDRHGSRVS